VAARGEASGRVDYLDGIRGVAIGAVLGVHWAATYLPVGLGGTIGVDIFFVLSGFIITTILWTWRADGGVGRLSASFLWRRVRRLYPALIGLLVLTPIFWVLAPDAPYPTETVLLRDLLAFVQGTWLPEALGRNMDPFRQTWSLAIEWYFYLLWAPLLLWLRSRGVAVGTLVLGTAVSAAVLYVVPMLTFDVRWYYFSPPAHFGELLAGAALALLMRHAPEAVRRWPSPEWLALLALVAIGAYVLFAPHPFTSDVLRYVGAPMATICALVLIWHRYSRTAGPVHLMLGSRPLALLGRVSYSLYLWHFLPIYLLDKDQTNLPAPLLGVLGVACAAVLTAGSYLLLERPFLGNRRDALAQPWSPRVGHSDGLSSARP
jgi:peptidoglycan/LPS O-acetylase OafA/YrhL